jgi:hypothetical protein
MTNGIDNRGLIEELEQRRIRSSMVLSYRLILDYQCTWSKSSVLGCPESHNDWMQSYVKGLRLVVAAIPPANELLDADEAAVG